MKRRAHGWSLVELLVALALLALLMVPVWMMLASARNVSNEFSREKTDGSVDEALALFEADLLHTFRGGRASSQPVFSLDPDQGAAWQRMVRDDRGRVLPVEILWMFEPGEGDWLRVERAPDADTQTAVTNRVLRSVTSVALRAGDPETPSTSWPPDDSAYHPPPWVGVRVQTQSEDVVSRDFVVPVALTAPPREEGIGR